MGTIKQYYPGRHLKRNYLTYTYRRSAFCKQQRKKEVTCRYYAAGELGFP